MRVNCGVLCLSSFGIKRTSMGELIAPESVETLRAHVIRALERYWPTGADRLEHLPIPRLPFPVVAEVPHPVMVVVPDWATDAAIDGALLVPREACESGEDWENVDWWLAVFLMLEGWHERVWELNHGSIHSYRFRLENWPDIWWDRAWVNRIALFVRIWAARKAGTSEEALFGKLPPPEIVVTHDVDAVSKTVPIRLKQSAFNGFNAVRLTFKGRIRDAGKRISTAIRFLFRHEDWWLLDEVVSFERNGSIRAEFNFYADDQPNNFKKWLFDPGYHVSDPRICDFVNRVTRDGWSVGLHPSYDNWKDAPLLRAAREQLSTGLGIDVTACRQHWLRFSWHRTWTAQETAGIERDTTIMFNDRPGFRTAAALRWRPWDSHGGVAHRLEELPTVLMDSHFYDYQQMSPFERRNAMKYWIDETRAVCGQIAVLWHPQTLSESYGWRDGFMDLLTVVGNKDERDAVS